MQEISQNNVVDIPYALDLLDRVNTLCLQHPELRERYLSEEYAPWATKQFYPFLRIREFSKSKSSDHYIHLRDETAEQNQQSFIHKVFSAVWMLSVSGIALLKLFILRPRVLVYETDRLARDSAYGDRLFTVLGELVEKKAPFLEFIHRSADVPMIKNFFTRKRIVFYIETIDILYKLWCVRKRRAEVARMCAQLDFSSITESEREFVVTMVRGYLEYLELVRYRSRVLRTLLRAGGYREGARPAAFVSIDDTRFVDEFVFACRGTSIQTKMFQHSNFDYLMGINRLDPTRYIFPDTFFVWNEYWKNKIPRLSPVYAQYRDRLVIGGRAYNYKFTAYDRSENTKERDTLEVVIPYEVALTESQIRPYVDAMYQDARIVMKLVLRGDFERTLQIKKYFTDEMLASGRAIPVEPKDKFETIARADVVLGVYSGFLDEVAESLIPVAIPKTDYVTMSSLLDDQVADEVTLGGTPLYDQLVKARDTDPEELRRRKDLLTQHTGDARTTVQDILREVGIL